MHLPDRSLQPTRYSEVMTWRGRTEFGDGFVAFSGRAGDNSFHSHPAYQLVFSKEPLSVDVERGARVSSHAMYIRPNVSHRLQASHVAHLFLIEPHSPIGRLLDCELPHAEAGECHGLEEKLWKTIDQSAQLPLDDRLHSVMNALSGPDALQLSIFDLAAQHDISPARLRELAIKQIGMTLGKWRLWTALGRACSHMAEGASAADAAYEAGFSDQAHLIRTMRKTLGVTPGKTKEALKMPSS